MPSSLDSSVYRLIFVRDILTSRMASDGKHLVFGDPEFQFRNVRYAHVWRKYSIVRIQGTAVSIDVDWFILGIYWNEILIEDDSTANIIVSCEGHGLSLFDNVHLMASIHHSTVALPVGHSAPQLISHLNPPALSTTLGHSPALPTVMSPTLHSNATTIDLHSLLGAPTSTASATSSDVQRFLLVERHKQ